MAALTLSRKVNETIVIGGNITITVVQVMGNKVRLCVQAPENVAIHRGEIQAKVDKEMEDQFKFLEPVYPKLDD